MFFKGIGRTFSIAADGYKVDGLMVVGSSQTNITIENPFPGFGVFEVDSGAEDQSRVGGGDFAVLVHVRGAEFPAFGAEGLKRHGLSQRKAGVGGGDLCVRVHITEHKGGFRFRERAHLRCAADGTDAGLLAFRVRGRGHGDLPFAEGVDAGGFHLADFGLFTDGTGAGLDAIVRTGGGLGQRPFAEGMRCGGEGIGDDPFVAVRFDGRGGAVDGGCHPGREDRAARGGDGDSDRVGGRAGKYAVDQLSRPLDGVRFVNAGAPDGGGGRLPRNRLGDGQFDAFDILVTVAAFMRCDVKIDVARRAEIAADDADVRAVGAGVAGIALLLVSAVFTGAAADGADRIAVAVSAGIAVYAPAVSAVDTHVSAAIAQRGAVGAAQAPGALIARFTFHTGVPAVGADGPSVAVTAGGAAEAPAVRSAFHADLAAVAAKQHTVLTGMARLALRAGRAEPAHLAAVGTNGIAVALGTGIAGVAEAVGAVVAELFAYLTDRRALFTNAAFGALRVCIAFKTRFAAARAGGAAVAVAAEPAVLTPAVRAVDANIHAAFAEGRAVFTGKTNLTLVIIAALAAGLAAVGASGTAVAVRTFLAVLAEFRFVRAVEAGVSAAFTDIFHAVLAVEAVSALITSQSLPNRIDYSYCIIAEIFSPRISRSADFHSGKKKKPGQDPGKERLTV